MRATTLWIVPVRAAIPACCLPQNQAKPIAASHFCALVYWWLALPPYNALGPTAPFVFQNAAYAACTEENKGNWMLCKSLPAEYTTFSPLAYSLDILLPWSIWGKKHWMRLLNWFEILYGWIASLLFVAIVSGISRRSETEK